jgi:hypothetical protein
MISLGFQLPSYVFHTSKKPKQMSDRQTRRSSLMSEELHLTSSQSLQDRRSDPTLEIKINNLVGEAVFLGLSHFGGKNVVESLVYILELEHSVNFRNVANELNTLRLGLAKMFGDAAYVVEEKVRNNLAKSLGLDPEGRSLEQLIEAAKKSLRAGSAEVPKND